MSKKKWICFNGSMINVSHITFMKPYDESLIIELGGLHYTFSQKFETHEKFCVAFGKLAEELGLRE